MAEARQTELIGQVARAVARLSNGEITELRLQLQPPELGRIELRLEVETEGTRVTILADVSSTGQLIERHQADLRQSLQQAGIHLAGLTIGREGGQAGGREEARSNGKAARSFKEAGERRPAIAGLERVAREGLSTGIDYRV